MIINLHLENPEKRKLTSISDDLRKGAVYIFPTDTVYAIVADANSKEGTEKVYNLKKLDKTKPLSLLCKDISMASQFIEYLPNEAYRLMKKITPKPCIIHHKDKHIGIRFPDHIYLQELLKIHDSPLTSTSVITDDEYLTNVEDLNSQFGEKVDGIVEGGLILVEPSTIIDFTGDQMIIIREGKGIEKI
jgi:tRNA threonylcarbamoyl adenosine modification protein (Sua5/YciO/YrdC/YwlC family)